VIVNSTMEKDHSFYQSAQLIALGTTGAVEFTACELDLKWKALTAI
jgi:hypothetical protein